MTATANPITSRTNARVKQLRAAFAGNPRLAGGLVGIEGATMLQEAVRSGMELKAVFVSQSYEAPRWIGSHVEVVRLGEGVFESATDTRTPQGIAALIEPPAWELEDVLREAAKMGPPLLLIAAGLQDPGNLGTLIRTAEAFGASAVLTTPGTVSAWNAKALRSSAGSVFRVPVVQVPVLKLRELRGVKVLAAVAEDAGSVPVTQVDLTAGCALLIGNEGRGLTPELLALADARITIPMPGPVESLNAAVAGSLLLYEAARQRSEARVRAASR